MQLRRAKELNDSIRMINREVRLREIFLDKNLGDFTFNQNISILRDISDWIQHSGFKHLSPNMKESDATLNYHIMLSYTKLPIIKSLSKLNNNECQDMCTAFKSLLSFLENNNSKL
jgi:hypothetical protein